MSKAKQSEETKPAAAAEAPAAAPPAASAKAVVASPSRRKLLAVSTISHDGTYYAPGSPLYVEAADAQRLIAIGAAKLED